MRAPAFVLLLVATAGCLSNDDAPADTTPPADDAADTTMTLPEAVIVTVGRGPTTSVPPMLYTLEPATLELRAGQPYTLTLQNDDPFGGHDLVIEGLDVAIDTIGAGTASEPVTFTPTEPGTYRMYCTIGKGSPIGHDEQGMHGEVVVL